jgi:putative transcriptional regulator
MSKLGKRLIEAAKEARTIARGDANPKSYRIFVPADVDVRQIRSKLKLSQTQFAARFGLPAATIRDWEQHRKSPDSAARILLHVIKNEPDAVARALNAVGQRRA